MSREIEQKPTKLSRPEPLSRNRILRTALRLADEEGIRAVSMRAVAARLSVKAMSLYNHVKNKDDILDGIIDLVAEEFVVPSDGGDWKEAMRDRAQSAHDSLLRHPWATLEIVSRINRGPAMLRYVDSTIRCLVSAGFSLENADHAWNLMDSMIYGFTLQELNFPFEESEYADVAEEHMPIVPVDEYPGLSALANLVMTKRYDGIHDFSFGIDIIVEALDQWRRKLSEA